MTDCKKCGSGNIDTNYIEKGNLLNSSSTARVEDEFVLSSEYDYFFKLIAKKEHLRMHCLNCRYAWRENVMTEEKQ